MFPPFPEEKAYSVCLEMIEDIKKGRLGIKRITAESSERMNHGIMLGALVCKDKAGKEIKLKALSGISHVFVVNYDNEGDSVYVPSIVDERLINAALSKNDELIHELSRKIKSDDISDKEKQSLKAKRMLLCSESLSKVYNLYKFHCADGKTEALVDICKNKLPPTGTGECCEPKLLDYAYSHDLLPLSMCEVFYNASDTNTVVEKSAPCDERCGLILPRMLGLNIVYRDNDIVVVNKQSGVLSVPGRGEDKQDCIVNRLRRLFPDCIEYPAAHRLDMETSGLMVLAFNKDAYRNLCHQFEEGSVKKHYIALLDGILVKKGIAETGTMELYFRLDINNRPHQIWDDVYGKKAITQWEILGVERLRAPDGSYRNVSRVRFYPHTGRTHQLRLASADEHGFGIPIVGDTLYGSCKYDERLMLHAEYLSFIHPVTEKKMEFYCKSEF